MMSKDLRERLHDLASDAPEGFELPPNLVRRARMRVAMTLTGAVTAIVVLGVVAVAGIRSLPDRQEVDNPTPTPTRTDDGLVGIDWASVPGVRVDEDAFVEIETGAIRPLPESIAMLEPAAFAVAPGGNVLLFEAKAGGSPDGQIFVANIDGTNVRQLTDAPDGAWAGAWSPDGSTIVAVVAAEGRDVDLVLIDAATGAITTLDGGPDGFVAPQFSADGQQIYFSHWPKHGEPDVLAIPVAGGDAVGLLDPVPRLEERYAVSFSPDGRAIAYWMARSDGRTGGFEVWVADADGSDPHPLVEDDAFSDHSSWSPDSTRIAYKNHSDDLIAVVDVASGSPTFSVLNRNATGAVWLDDDTLLVDVEG